MNNTANPKSIFERTVPGTYKYDHPTGTYYATYNGGSVELRFYPTGGRAEFLGTFGTLTQAATAARDHCLFGRV